MAQYREAKTPASQGKKIDHLRIYKGDHPEMAKYGGEAGGHVVMHHYAEDGLTHHNAMPKEFGPHEGQDMLDHIAKNMNVHAAEPEPESPDREREEEEV